VYVHLRTSVPIVLVDVDSDDVYVCVIVYVCAYACTRLSLKAFCEMAYCSKKIQKHLDLPAFTYMYIHMYVQHLRTSVPVVLVDIDSDGVYAVTAVELLLLPLLLLLLLVLLLVVGTAIVVCGVVCTH
jgi:hypothetical protein